jgi:exopolysaccharide biosynthesis polyprenyl glycosylphosphotransferase
MENTASISDSDAVQAAIARYSLPEPPYAAESAAGRVSRIGGRTARRVLVTDLTVLGLASIALWRLAPVVGAPDISAGAGILLALLTIAGFAVSSLYATVQRPNPDAIDEARRVAVSVGFAALAWILIGAVVSERPLEGNLAMLVAGWITVTTFTTLACRRSIRRRALVADPERLLIIGAGTTAQVLARRVAETSGATVVGFIDDDPLPLDPSLEGIPVFDDASGLGPVIEVTGATRVVIAFSRRSSTDILESIRNSRFGGIPISVVPRYFEITPSHARLSEIDGVPLLDLHSARLSWGSRLTKRILDVSLASLGLLVLSPLFLVVAIGIKMTSPGGVFFGQQRMGHNGEVFRMWKFRTMVQDAEGFRMGLAHLNEMGESTPLFKIRHDPRVTRIGRVLRRYSIDELPQLMNVVNGTMSLVGPRPFVVHEAEQMLGWSQRRLDLVPGITGLWQVRGRNDVPYEEMIRLDYMYVTNWSVWWDIRLLLQTIPGVLTGRGAS